MAGAILVPGGGLRDGGRLPAWVRARLDRALELWDGELVVTLSAGTPHRPPPLDTRGFPLLESVAGARYLLDRGLPPEYLAAETSSYGAPADRAGRRAANELPHRR